MKYYLYVFLFILSTVNAQIKLTNKEFYILQDKVRILTSKNIDSTFLFANKIEKSENHIHKAFAKGVKGYLFQTQNDSISSKKNFSESLFLINKAPNGYDKIKNKAYLYNYGGLSDWLRGDYKNAFLKYQKGEELSKEVNDIIQMIKFNTNIALINGEIGNYRFAIKKSLKSEQLLDENKKLYTLDQYKLNKSNIYLNLGNFYVNRYKKEKRKNPILLDSGFYYNKKTISFSFDNIKNNIASQLNIAIIYSLKNNFNESEKAYQNVVSEAKENKFYNELNLGIYNLGYLYYKQKKYSKALVYFKKTDSIYNVNKSNIGSYINSNYYQSKIYENFSDNENALIHANLFLDFFSTVNENIIKQSNEINYNQNIKALEKEMKIIKEKHSNSVIIRKVVYAFFGILFVLLLSFYLLKSKKNKVNELKYKAIIEEFEEKIKRKETYENQNSTIKLSSNISLDEKKENVLFLKLIELEEKKTYLNQDYTLQFVAKKIKTNTTYLSFVVNKRFGKSFSEYANELKINYAINEMITNPTYRKYSTQAIAESVGYKNATSFTKVFHKKTGLSPVKFAETLNKKSS
jgi:AraC-like DNA-binding protein